MKLTDVQKHLNAKYLCLDGSDPEISCCMAADMMSDVLAYAEAGALLITGLISSQSVRTADVSDAAAVIYIRGKRPDEKTIKLAEDLNLPLLTTDECMFDACGVLYKAGLKGVC